MDEELIRAACEAANCKYPDMEVMANFKREVTPSVVIGLIDGLRHAKGMAAINDARANGAAETIQHLRDDIAELRAKLPSQGGEAVEVVCITQGGCNVTWTATKELTPAGTALMSVRQHQRILAASVGSAEPVAYAAFADNGNIRMWCRSAIGMCELFDAHGNKAVPLYTHPADQVADDLTMVKVLRELLEQIAVELEHDNDRYLLGRELRALLASAEGGSE